MGQVVRCKFICVAVTKRTPWNRGAPGFLYDAEFQPVTSGSSEENKAFFEATPSGSLKLATYKEDHFQPGLEYYINIAPA